MAMNRRTTTAKTATKTATVSKPAATAAKGKDDKGPDKNGFLRKFMGKHIEVIRLRFFVFTHDEEKMVIPPKPHRT